MSSHMHPRDCKEGLLIIGLGNSKKIAAASACSYPTPDRTKVYRLQTISPWVRISDKQSEDIQRCGPQMRGWVRKKSSEGIHFCYGPAFSCIRVRAQSREQDTCEDMASFMGWQLVLRYCRDRTMLAPISGYCVQGDHGFVFQ